MAQPDPSPPESNAQPLSLISLITWCAGFIALAASEWLPLLVNQPISPPFKYDAPFSNEALRVSRLLSIVVVILFFLRYGLLLLDVKVAMMNVITAALITLIICFIVALFYNIFAHLFRVRMYPPIVLQNGTQKTFASQWQILFAVLYTFVPWLPIFTFLGLAVFSLQVLGTAYSLVLLSFFVSLVYAFYNYVKAMRMITNCPSYRIWLSSLAPILLVVSFSLFRC